MGGFTTGDVQAQAIPPAPAYTVFEATGPITVDGVLDEADWELAQPIPLAW